MKLMFPKKIAARTIAFARLMWTAHGKAPVAVALFALVGLPLFIPSAAVAADPFIVKGADTAYYFDKNRKLVAVEELNGFGREIEKSKTFANEDGMTLVLKSTCQGGVPQFDGKTDMVGLASTVVYSVTGPSLLVILGVEDLRDVRSRIILPMKPLDDGATCCCKMRNCGGFPCCPCGTNC